MQKIINLDLKNIKHYLTGGEKIIVLGFLVIVFGFMFSGSAFADNVNYSVSIAPSLKLTIPDSSLILNLTPPTKTFDSKNLTVSVGTNNKTGYKLTLSTPNDNTNLNRDSSGDSVSATISTLDAGTYTESTFTANKWGYKINSNTAIPSIITTDYIPFVSGNTLMESDTAVNHDETELTFAAKIDYLQPSGAYNTTLQFNIVANPDISIDTLVYLQDFNTLSSNDKLAVLNSMMTGISYSLDDSRDEQTYTIAKLADGNVWMTRNLAIGCAGIGTTYSNTYSQKVLDSMSSNVLAPSNTSTTSVSADSYTVARQTCNATYGAYYNYCAASAGTVCTSSNSDEANYNICPAGWTLPTRSQYSGIINYVDAFDPVSGGFYVHGAYYSGSNNGGAYWSSSAYNGSARYWLRYRDNAILEVVYGEHYQGFSVRCIMK